MTTWWAGNGCSTVAPAAVSRSTSTPGRLLRADAESGAARLRGLARGGQVLLSRVTAELVADQLPAGAGLADVGAQQLRGLSRAEHVFALVHPDLPRPRRRWSSRPASARRRTAFDLPLRPTAWGRRWSGPRPGSPTLNLTGRAPFWRHWLERLAGGHTLVRYDERGCGLSDRDVEDLSLEAWMGDLETVVDAANLDRFALLGISHGGPVAVA